MLERKLGKKYQVRAPYNHPNGVMGWKGYFLKSSP
jgi:hypothetical protein